MRLKDKIAVITGGAGGIGFALARAYVDEGAKVVIVDLDKEAGLEAITELQKISPDSMFIQKDLSEHSELAAMIDQIAERYGKIDILINNAHASRMSAFEDATLADFNLSFDTGFYPTFYLMQAALPYLKKSKGKIINFSSGAGIEGHEHQVSYAAAKEAIRGMSRVAANEFGPHGITVNIISPFAKSEGMIEWAKENPELYEKSLSKIPLRRPGELEEIASVAVFLGSKDSDYMTGQTFMVDGGSIKLR